MLTIALQLALLCLVQFPSRTLSALNRFVYVSQPRNWDAAQDYCVSQYNTQLASITSPAANQQAWAACQTSSCWIGLFDSDPSTSAVDWEWIDDTNYDHYLTGWAPGVNPLDTTATSGKECGRIDTAMNAEGWNYDNCSVARQFLCHSPDYVFPYIFVNTAAYWSDARSACSSTYGTELASIHSLEEAGDAVYLTSTVGSSTSSVWLGLRREVGGWNWTDSSAFDFEHWSPNTPAADVNFCGEMLTSTNHYGLWQHRICTNAVRTYLCAHPDYLEPTSAPSSPPTANPSDSPTVEPTAAPSDSPTYSPSHFPSQPPTKHPSDVPSNAPVDPPTAAPSAAPTNYPVDAPTYSPSAHPTHAPSDNPSDHPTNSPTEGPTPAPSNSPTAVPTPPTAAPTPPTDSPSNYPSDTPTDAPSDTPTDAPSDSPSKAPTDAPTDAPTAAPTPPTDAPTDAPSDTPTNVPTGSPTPDKTNKYYKVSTAMTWQNAENYCVSTYGTHLASIMSSADQTDALATCGTSWCWIGLYDADTGSAEDWDWISGAEYEHYTSGWIGSGDGSNNHCAVIVKDLPPLGFDGWASSACTNTFPFLCHSPHFEYPYVFVNSAVTWGTASSACQNNYGTHLASVHSDEDSGHAVYLISTGGASTHVWIGLKTTSSSAYWSDGTSYDYQHWNPGEPNGDSGYCGEIYIHAGEYGEWNDRVCNNANRAYLCANPNY